MYYVFDKNKETEFRVWLWNDDWHDKVIIEENKEIELEINEDNDGTYFKYKDNKYYLKGYYKFTYEDIRDMLEKEEIIPSDYITQMVLNEINSDDKLTILIPMKFLNYNSEIEDLVICEFKDIKGLSYRIKDNYKFNIVYTDEDGYNNRREFYTSDLASLINDGTFILNR